MFRKHTMEDACEVCLSLFLLVGQEAVDDVEIHDEIITLKRLQGPQGLSEFQHLQTQPFFLIRTGAC